MSAIPDYVDGVLKEWDAIAYFAYDGFEREGRGTVAVERDISGSLQFIYLPADFFQQQRDTEVIRLLELYDPATEFLVLFQDSDEATRTLRIRTPDGGQNPKGIWFFRMLAIVTERLDVVPDYLPEGFFRALEGLKKARKEETRGSVPTLDHVLEEAKRDARVCPQPLKWKELWEMLPAKRRKGAGWEPPLPLILAAWHETPHLSKLIRLQEHIRWADLHGVLPEVYDFLKSLNKDDWYYGD